MVNVLQLALDKKPSRQGYDYDEIARLLGVARCTLPNFEELPQSSLPTPQRISVQPLTDDEWKVLSAAMPALPVPRPGGFRDRQFFDAALWYLHARDRGLGWAALPADFPPRMTMQHRWHRWAVSGTWEAVAAAVQEDERLSANVRRALQRIALDAARKRERVLAARRRLNES